MPNNQSLALTQEQRQIQTLAPQLRQSLELLQVPVLELRALIQKELQQNPVLEEKGSDVISLEPQSGIHSEAFTLTPRNGSEREKTQSDEKELKFKEEFDVLMRLDRETYDYFMREYEPDDANTEKKRNFAMDMRTREESLQEHLVTQLSFLQLPEHDLRIGELIIGSINDEGYLTQGIADLAVSAGCEESSFHDVLAVIQDFDPVGVGARDLKECLLIQLHRFGHDSPLAAGIVSNHLDLMAAKNYGEIAKKMNATPEEVRQAAKMIAILEPHPGRAFGGESAPYVFPEIFIEKREDGYRVVLNDDRIPQIRISKYYQQLMADSKSTDEVKKYIRDKIHAGLFLMKSIDQRQRTIRRVATEIVKVQSDFFDFGVSHLKPLTMASVARQVGLHETTISRCVANKFMQTPAGVFEMKYFFTPGLKNKDGNIISNKAVQDMIAEMVAEEDAGHPLSDQEIFERLSAGGLQVARRTVAKYRLALKIPPSHMRKSG